MKKPKKEKRTLVVIGNRILAITIGGALIAAAFLIGRSTTGYKGASNYANSTEDIQPETATPVVSTTRPIKQVEQPAYQPQPTATAQPTQPPERKKVPITITTETDPAYASTYYCYEDMANTIASQQSIVNLVIRGANNCASMTNTQITICYNSCGKEGEPSCDTCPSGKECEKDFQEIDEARNKLRELISNHCP